MAKQWTFSSRRAFALAAAFIAFILPASASLAFAASTATVVGITSPANGSSLTTLASISGSAEADVAVASVAISVMRFDGYYWNGSTWTLSGAMFGVPYSTVSHTWDYSTLPVWVSSYPYVVRAQARDTEGDYSDIAESTFYFQGNTAPEIISLTAASPSLYPLDLTDIVCAAADADSDTLSYFWTAEAGSITGSGASVTWTAPAATGTFTVNCEVSDGMLTAQDSVQLTVGGGDTIAPAAPYVASAAPGSAAGSLNIIWLNTGDDGNSGNISGGAFKIAYSTLPGTVQYITPQITQAAGLTAGATQGYTLTGLAEGATYYVAVKLADEVPNWSELSSAATGWARVAVSTVADHTPPTVGLVSPAPGNAYLGALSVISATASDGVAVTSVTLTVRRSADGYYWNGSGWAASQNWLNAVYSGGEWSYSQLPVWVTGSSYTVVARAKDGAENWSSAYSTGTFVFDDTEPIARVSSPVDGASVSGLTQISGTAYDAVGLSLVQVALKRQSDGKYWADSVWNSTPVWNSATGTTSWAYTAISGAALADGTDYVAMCRAYDYAGNVSGTNDSSTFTYVAASSTGTLGAAAFSGISTYGVTMNWTSDYPEGTYYYVRLSSSASSAAYFVGGVSTHTYFSYLGLSPNNQYYGYVSTTSGSGYTPAGSAYTLAQAPVSPVFSEVGRSSASVSCSGAANGAGTYYQYEVSASSAFGAVVSSAVAQNTTAWLTGLSAGSTYYARVRAANGDLVYTPYVYVSSPAFMPGQDVTGPSVVIYNPHDGYYLNSAPSIVGVAGDDVAVSSVQIAIRHLSTGTYWNGSAWTVQQAWLPASYNDGGWVYPSTAPAFISGSSYVIVARAMDTSGNWSVAYDTVTFVFDNTKPVARVSSPANGTAVAGFTGLSGTAYDAVALSLVQVALKRQSDGKYWADSVWNSTTVWNSADGTASWAYTAISSAALTAGTTYVAMCRASDYAGNVSGTNDSSTFTYSGIAPAGTLSAVTGSVLGTGSVQWSWNYAGTAYAFGVFSSGEVLIATVPFSSIAASYLQAGLAPNTAVSVKVAAFDGAGFGPLKTSATYYTLAAVPGAVSMTARSSVSVSVAWTASANPAGTLYMVARDVTSAFTAPFLSTSTAVAYSAAGLLPSTTYYFKARAMNGAGAWSDYGPAAAAMTLPAVAARPAAPAGTALGVSSITWTWTPVPYATGYLVYQDEASFLDHSSAAYYVQEGLAVNTTYSFMVAAVNDTGVGQLSPAAAPVSTLANMPSAVTIAAVYAASATVSWNLNSNPAGTAVRVLRHNVETAAEAVIPASGTSFTDTGLLGCTSYYFSVWNLNRAGLPTARAQSASFVTAIPVPAAPGNFYAEQLSGASIALHWEPAPFEGITSYLLYSNNGTGAINYSSPLAEISSALTSYTASGLTPGASYKFGLRARHRCGLTEANTNVVATAKAVSSLDGVRAAIKIPQTGKRVNGNSVTVMAELILGTVAETRSVKFQYKASASDTWQNITAKDANHPNPDLNPPYFIHWDVSAVTPGSYDLRAVATDIDNNNDDSAPGITIAVDGDEADITENDDGSGDVKKEQKVSNLVPNTLQAGDAASAQVTKLEIPAGALEGSTATVSVTNNPALVPPTPTDAASANVVVQITLTNQSQLASGKTATVTLVFPDADGDGIVDGTGLLATQLEMYSASSLAGPWSRDLSSVVDLVNKKVTGYTSHFSYFALFSVPAGSLDTVHAYPVPWKPGTGGSFDDTGITIAGLTGAAKIKIFTITGQLVREHTQSASDTGYPNWTWDGKNSSGKKAASGIYLAYIKAAGAEKVIKLAVER